MRVPCGEGLATQAGPESCAGPREGVGEALTGERGGRSLRLGRGGPRAQGRRPKPMMHGREKSDSSMG